MVDINTIGCDWISDRMQELTDSIKHVTPSIFNEENRYLPKAVTSMPGFLSYDINPFMREIVDCCDVDSPVREVSLMKGVQITYTTALESILLYFMCHIRTSPMMYITADKELASARIENNIIPMLNHSGFADIIRSSDTGNKRKTGKTANHIQIAGGGYLVPFGARNADKMRSYSMLLMLKDEIDAWPLIVGPPDNKDGDPDKLSDHRCKGYWESRKIFRGSTPKIKGVSKIEKAYKKGDQRKYHVKCKNRKCSILQVLRWEIKNEGGNFIGGFRWDLDEDGLLMLESVRYVCPHCQTEHFEYDKENLFSEKHGAKWIPTAKPVEPNIRSYHLPAFYSPIGMAPWYSLVADYLEAWDHKKNKVKDIGKWQTFYNNVLAETFEIMGAKVHFEQVSAHRRTVYTLGMIPNKYALKYSGSNILLLTCSVDVHKRSIFVKVCGWCKGSISYIIDYWKIESKSQNSDSDCRTDINNSVWQELREIIENKSYTADDGKKYIVNYTLIDANGLANDTVTKFCNQYVHGVVPILGRDAPAKSSKISEFSIFTTKTGTEGYTITVDHYKNRMASVLRRQWNEDEDQQQSYHFNAPVDITDAQLKELSAEVLRKKIDPKGIVSHEWHRPGNKPNELWDLMVYGHAAVEIIAYNLCIKQFELETIDWARFWEYIEVEKLYFTEEAVLK